MTGRERIRAIVAGQPADRCGLWLGAPHDESWPRLHAYFGTTSPEDLRRKLGDDFRHIHPESFPDFFPGGAGALFGGVPGGSAHGAEGPLAGCEDVRDLERFPWPDAGRIGLDGCLAALRGAGDVYRAGGLWTPFYHKVMNLFGMENYLVKMYTHPEVVHAVTDRVCRFYHDANERLFEAAGGEIDGFFFGNDFGTQLDLICGPVQFDEFILPWFRRFIEQAHQHGHQAILHSCGSIHKVIARLIEAKVDMLHPLQARAVNMGADVLARDFKGRVAFMGGVDTQELLVHATPEEVKIEVRRIRQLLGPRWVVSPSHETVLPNVPPENLEAMAEAARERVSPGAEAASFPRDCST